MKEKPHSKPKKDEPLNLSSLEFEDALSALLQIKPVNNKELATPKKKKRKPTSEK